MSGESAARPTALPVFSARLDEVMAAMLNGSAPNVGRFCGYCYTPLGKKWEECAHCHRSTAAFPPVAKIPSEFFDLFRRMRKRESLIVNSFAYLGLTLALILFIGLVALAVYRYEASVWMLAFATGVLIVGGRVFAGLLGGWIGDQVGYDFAQRKLAVEWEAYESEREARLGRAPAPRPADAATALAASAPGAD